MKRPLPNTYWVIDGRLLAGEYPGGDSPVLTRKRLAKLLAAGIDSFVDLTESGECEPYRDQLPPEADYYRRPMPDHGVPADVAAMHEVVAVLRSALATGRKVYVHCRAGIGRTGMSVACHLREGEGLDAAQALARLNELWQQNARAARWPRVPETEEQVAFVLGYVPVGEVPALPVGLPPETVPVGAAPAATATSSSRLRALGPLSRGERARGALLGLAVGDALAVSLQDEPPGTPVPQQFTGGGRDELPPGAWTDETAMALCLADSLLACGGSDTRDQAERYLRWLRDGHRSATGVAAGVRPALRRSLALAATRHSALSGSHDPTLLDSEPLARCAPAAIYYADDLAAAAEAAADAARVSHQAPVLVDACRLFAGMVHAALNGADKAAILAHHTAWRSVLKPEVLAIAQGWSPGRRTGAARRPQGAILQTLDSVARSFAAAADFRTGLAALLALPEGQRGDADVAAAAYGQLAGAAFGERGIPSGLRAALVEADEIAALAEALLPAAASATESSTLGARTR